MRAFAWLFRGFIFFTLFAFALNNQQPASVHWFFGLEWEAPMVIIVLASFAAGCAVGVVAVLPNWLRARRARRPGDATTTSPAPLAPAAPPPAPAAWGAEGTPALPHPPREGLGI